MPAFLSGVSWSFPGGLRAAIIILAVALVVAAVSYWLALVRIPRPARILLALFRAAAVALILFCLCGPETVREIRSEPDAKPKVAVVFDESGSMDVKGFWGASRRDKELEYWKNTLSKQEKNYELESFAFAKTLRDIPDPARDLRGRDEDEGSRNDPAPTHLYEAAAEWGPRFSSEGFSGVVCLTDGTDTSGGSQKEALDALRRSNLPHIFVSMDEALPSRPFADIVRLEAPSTAPVGTKTNVGIMVQASGIDASQPLEMVIRKGMAEVARKPVQVFDNQTASQSLSFELPVETDETVIYEASLQMAGKALTKAKWSVTGRKLEAPSVLLYQGTLDWGTRHLRGIFDRSGTAQLTFMLAPGASGESVLAVEAKSFPNKEQLSKFNVVMLFGVRPGQLSEQAAADLAGFVSNGGGLLMLYATPLAAATYGASFIPELLPVSFDPDARVERETASASMLEIWDSLKKLGSNSRGGDWTVDFSSQDPWNNNTPRKRSPPLSTVKLTREGMSHSIFSYAFAADGKLDETLLPKYATLSPIVSAKPGALALATGAEGRIALAVESYGRGRTAALATDPLWRWKMSIPSSSDAYTQFWRQLMGYLAGDINHTPVWMLDSAVCPPNKVTEIGFFLPVEAGDRIGDLKFTAEAGKDSTALSMTAAGKTGEYRTTFSLKPDTSYRLVAWRGTDIVAQAFVTGQKEQAKSEMMSLKPDKITLGEMAAAGHGALLNAKDDFDWAHWITRKPSELIRIERTAIWHSPWLLCSILVLFLAELLIRRLYRMI